MLASNQRQQTSKHLLHVMLSVMSGNELRHSAKMQGVDTFALSDEELRAALVEASLTPKSAPLSLRIGHPAYSGSNSVAYASSKSEAIRILRERGVNRDIARAAIKTALSGSHAVMYGGPGGLDVIELCWYEQTHH